MLCTQMYHNLVSTTTWVHWKYLYAKFQFCAAELNWNKINWAHSIYESNYSIKSQYVIPIDLTWPNQSFDHMIGVTWSLGPTKMIVLLCYMVPSDQIVPFVPNSFLTYQAIYKSSHRTINGSPGIVPNDCMIFPYYHIGPNCHIRPNYCIGLDCYVGLDQHIGSNW